MLTADDVLPRLLRRRAAEEPDHVLITDVSGARMTNAELDREVRRWAAALARLGVHAGDPVATMMPNRFDAFAAWIGLAWMRAVEIPVNTAYVGSWLAYVLADSQARVAVVSAQFLPRLVDIASDLSALEVVVVPDAEAADLPAGMPFRLVAGAEFLDGVEPAEDLEGPLPSDLACVVYTSGTTGRSKGVMMYWGQQHAAAAGSMPQEAREPGRVYYSPFPPFHVTGKAPLYGALLDRGGIVIREVFSTTEFWKDITDHGCTATLVVGAMANFLFQQPEQPGDADNPLRYVIMAPVIPQVEEFAKRFGVRVCTAYSMTELSAPLVSDGFDVTAANFRSCGRPRPGFQVRVVNERDEPVGPGEIGELVVRGEDPWTMMAGYWGMPEETLRSWRNLWFHTGDSFTYDEHGDFFFVDRVKDAVRRRGENISSFEVEAVVNTHPAVMESAAIAAPSEHTEDDVMVVVVPMPGQELDPAELISYLVPRMPRFAIPRYVRVLPELPKTPTARVRKVELRESGVTADTWDREAAGVTIPR